MCTSHCSNEIIEAIIVALAQACPDRAMGGWGRRLRIALNGTDPRTGRRFIWHMFQARPGGGGSAAGDGYSTIGEWHSAGGIKFGSIEVAETRFPLVFETHEYRLGIGRRRAVSAAAMAATCACASMPKVSPMQTPPARAWCMAPAASTAARTAHRTTTRCWRPATAPRKLKSKEINVPVPSGSVIHVLSGGGGGWGDPALRDPADRAADKAEGLV